MMIMVLLTRLTLRQRWEQQDRGGSAGPAPSSTSNASFKRPASSSSSARHGSSSNSRSSTSDDSIKATAKRGAAAAEADPEVVLCSPDKPKINKSRTPSDAFDHSKSDHQQDGRGLVGPLGRPGAAPLSQLLQKSSDAR